MPRFDDIWHFSARKIGGRKQPTSAWALQKPPRQSHFPHAQNRKALHPHARCRACPWWRPGSGPKPGPGL